MTEKQEQYSRENLIDPAEEEAYWRKQHASQPYAGQSRFEDYQAAYRLGYEGCSRFQGRPFAECEPELRQDYEKCRGTSGVAWEKARPAVRAAWSRADRNLERFMDYDVEDRNQKKIGSVECLWSDHTGNAAFIGVKTGWIFGKTHVVPADNAEVSDPQRVVRLPYDEQKVKDAPSYGSGLEMTAEKESEIYNYYGVGRRRESRQEQRQPTAASSASRQPRPEQATIQLSEEQMKVGKREVEAGGVRLRKVVRTEVVHQPVELKREEIVIERVPASEAHSGRQAAFTGQEVYIPLRREEPVIEKEAQLREEVRARKSSTTDRQDVSAEVRKEDVDIKEEGEARRTDPRGGGAARDLRQQEEKPRSQRRRE